MGGLDRVLIEQVERGVARRKTSVLVARLSGNVCPTDAAAAAPEQGCLNALVQAAAISGGRVVRRQRDVLMALFGSGDAAAAAAVRMHAYTTGNAERSTAFSVRIAFVSGPLIQKQNDVQGDTVNLALALSREARKGQVLTLEATASGLSPAVLNSLAPPSDAREEHGEQDIRELRWREGSVQILAAQTEAFSKSSRTILRLEYQGKVLLRRRELEYVSFGRDAACEICVAAETASRRHCTVTRQDGGFALRDHSTNGTYVTLDGEGEIYVHSEACLLGKKGRIALGEPGATSSCAIEYAVLPA